MSADPIKWGEPIFRFPTKDTDLGETGREVLKNHGLLPADVPPPPANIRTSDELRYFYEVVCWLVVRRKFEPVDVRIIGVYAKTMVLYNRLLEHTVDPDTQSINSDAIKLLPAVMNSVRAMALNLGIGPTTRARWMARVPGAPAGTGGEQGEAAAAWQGLLTSDGRTAQ